MAQTFATRRSVNRRKRVEARQQILDAARLELQSKPFRELSVDQLMSATGLSRTAFYRYFPDREAVLLELLEEVWGQLAEARDAETVGADLDDPSSISNLTRLLTANHGVLRAIADAAPGDEELESAYRAFMRSYWADDLTARVVEAQSRGLATGLDPQLTGQALGWMMERMVTQGLDDDARQVLETLIVIVRKCLYDGTAGRQPAHWDQTSSSPRERVPSEGVRTEAPAASRP